MITTIINAHREGVLAGPSVRSHQEAVAVARQAGHDIETIVVLDRADATTQSLFEDFERGHKAGFQILRTDLGDPGLARNAGVAAARGAYVAFLDADDLWSYNWLVEGHRLAAADPSRCIAHSEVNITFGNEAVVWWHPDSLSPDCDLDYMRVSNYWDALAFAGRAIYEKFPFQANNLREGYGHEDWHWNCVTLAHGLRHRPAPGTVHFKRRRKGSQMAMCDENDVVIWPNDFARYAFELPSAHEPAAAAPGIPASNTTR